jgi:spermidine synthase
MTAPTLNPSGHLAASPRFLPLLLILLLFMGSGCSALIYEIVWLQSLQLVIGSSAVSLGVLLGTFMGGMCLGSLVLPRWISIRRHPLRVYALMELCLGALGVAILLGLPYADRLYVAHVRPGWASILMRGAICAACLLPPTLLMGATLPVVARWVKATPEGIAWLGLFYGGNIGGAVFGCLLAGFYLLRVHDMVVATGVAAALNVSVALLGVLLAGRVAYEAPPVDPLPHWEPRASGAWLVYVAIGLSGLCALGAEVVWTRILSLLLGATVYTFSIILAVFLTGLGIGSSIGSALARLGSRPRAALAGCQLLLMGAIAWAAYMLADSLPYWPINPSLSTSPWLDFQLDLLRCAWVVLPGAILWGASFPLALASVASRGQDPGHLVGGVYAANTLGAIVGSLGFSMVLIPRLGTHGSQQVMIGSAAAAVLLVLMSLPGARAAAERAGRRPAGWPVWVGLGSVPVLAGGLIGNVPALPTGLVAYGRLLPTQTQMFETLYVGEGMNATVAVTRQDDGVTSFHVSGKVEASTTGQDMRLQRMLGHIPALLHPGSRSILVVGCGAGVTAGTFVLHPGVERIVLCEIEPLIPRVAAGYFGAENYDVVRDPRVAIVYDDARHYILTTHEKFDVITSDPIHPWVKGSAALYTREYFELCRRHLNPGGVVTQWVPLYESSVEAVKSEMATFFAAFPYGTIWSNDAEGEGYDVVLLGQADPPRIDVDGLQRRLERDDYSRVAASLREVGFRSATDLLATYAGCGADLRLWLTNASLNTDRNLRLQYLAGIGLNAYRGESIYREILACRRFPEDLFVAAPERKLRLREALGRRPPAP